MKKLIYFLTIPVIFALLFVGCKKKEDVPPPVATVVPTYTSIADFFNKNQVASQTFTLNATTGATITGNQGTKITFPSNSFVTSSNQTVTGNVNIELKEIYKKSDMILSNKPTMSFGNLLKSGGEYYIKVTQNNQELKLAQGSMYSAQMPTDSLDYNMQVFTGTVNDTTGNTNWVPADSSTSYVNYQTTPMSYILACDSLHWINCDYFSNVSPMTTVTISIPNNPSPQNTVVYLAFKTKAIAQLYNYNSNYLINNMPENYTATIVAFTVSNDKIYSLFKPITIATNMQVNVTLVETTDAEFKTQLIALN